MKFSETESWNHLKTMQWHLGKVAAVVARLEISGTPYGCYVYSQNGQKEREARLYMRYLMTSIHPLAFLLGN